MSVSYFDLPEVSNSDLKALGKMIFGIEDNRESLEDILNFGSLVDAMLTETWRVTHLTCTLHLETGGVIQFTPEAFLLAKKLSAALKADRVVSMLVDTMIGQYVFAKTIGFKYQGEEFEIRGRCKFDGFNKKFKLGCDYKTTACTSYAQFKNSIDHFDYDQQGAWYMDLAGIDRHWIIGISKKNSQVFKYAIERGDETYLNGVRKYSRLAYLWKLLIEDFKIELI